MCQQVFNGTTNIPKQMPNCSHTECLSCVKRFQPQIPGTQRELACPYCKTRFAFDKPPEALPTNEKVLKIVEIMTSGNPADLMKRPPPQQYYQLGVSPEDQNHPVDEEELMEI